MTSTFRGGPSWAPPRRRWPHQPCCARRRRRSRSASRSRSPAPTAPRRRTRCAAPNSPSPSSTRRAGSNGRKAELLVRDDKLDPGEAATRTLELIEKDGVRMIVGSLSASVQLAVNNVTRERKVLYNSISQSDQITALPDWSRYTFHEGLTPHLTAGAVGRYAFGKFGKRVVFLSADYAYGREMVDGFKAAGQPAGHRGRRRAQASAGRDRLLHPAAAHPGAQAGHPLPVQFRPRPADLHPPGQRFRPEADDADRGADPALYRRRRRGPGPVQRRRRRHVVLLGRREHHPGGQGVQRPLPQGV